MGTEPPAGPRAHCESCCLEVILKKSQGALRIEESGFGYSTQRDPGSPVPVS